MFKGQGEVDVGGEQSFMEISSEWNKHLFSEENLKKIKENFKTENLLKFSTE